MYAELANFHNDHCHHVAQWEHKRWNESRRSAVQIAKQRRCVRG